MAMADRMHEVLEQSMGFSTSTRANRDSRALSREQVSELCRKLGRPLEPPSCVDDAMDVMDSHGSGSVTMSQFEAWWKSRDAPDPPDAAGSEFHALVVGGAVHFSHSFSLVYQNILTFLSLSLTFLSCLCHSLKFLSFLSCFAQQVAQQTLAASHADPDDPTVRTRLGANADAYKMFCELDEDGSGGLDEEELFHLSKRMGISKSLTKKKLKKVFQELEFVEHGEPQGFVTFEGFADYYNTTQERLRRAKVRYVKELFKAVDKDGSGRLDKEEFGRLAAKAQLGLDPPFNLETDWAKCKKTKDLHDSSEDEVNYSSFEAWWRERLGISAPMLPVLPEHMVGKVEEAARFDMKQRRNEAAKQGKDISGTGVKYQWGKPPPGPAPHPARPGKELWALLRPRLLTLTRMQRQWGGLHDIYDAVNESRYESVALPPSIRDPDSSFSACWDLTQVFLLLYVAITVPLRAGFEIEVALWSVGFFVDMVIDCYFVADICLNFRTAIWLSDGTREHRPKEISKHYLRGWFGIDFVSTLPVSYLAYLGDDPDAVVSELAGSLGGDAGGPGAGSNFRALKALRLVRLSKMLRLARIKKILMKYSQDPHMQSYISVFTTLFAILFMVHLLTCFYCKYTPQSLPLLVLARSPVIGYVLDLLQTWRAPRTRS